ncbi:hypothetical protein G3V73_24115, partial [Escherichia coli]|nr:hypothetical protein [Escherichia coli]
LQLAVQEMCESSTVTVTGVENAVVPSSFTSEVDTNVPDSEPVPAVVVSVPDRV